MNQGYYPAGRLLCPAQQALVQLAAKVGYPPIVTMSAYGPMRPLTTTSICSGVVRQIGHSCIAQHLRTPKDGSAAQSRQVSNIRVPRRCFLEMRLVWKVVDRRFEVDRTFLICVPDSRGA